MILETPIPAIDLTCPLRPVPLVPVSSKVVKSPTLYPIPPSKICKLSISPVVTDSTVVNCLKNSLDSTMKSLSAKASPTLYGKVFLDKLELLKSNSCDNVVLDDMKGDL